MIKGRRDIRKEYKGSGGWKGCCRRGGVKFLMKPFVILVVPYEGSWWDAARGSCDTILQSVQEKHSSSL
jgi:hypothetical protein